MRGRIGHRLRVPDEPGHDRRPRRGRRAGDDAVVVGGVALRFHQRLSAAVRARGEVRPSRGLAVEAPRPRPSPSRSSRVSRGGRSPRSSPGGPVPTWRRCPSPCAPCRSRPPRSRVGPPRRGPSYEIDPAKPPLPTPWSFRFQPAAGIHTSISICESLVGRMTPATRQNAGRPVSGLSAGGLKVPDVTASAVVIVACGSRRLARLSQVRAGAGAAPASRAGSDASASGQGAIVAPAASSRTASIRGIGGMATPLVVALRTLAQDRRTGPRSRRTGSGRDALVRQRRGRRTRPRAGGSSRSRRRISAPAGTATRPSTRRPSTHVPFRLPRSSTDTPSAPTTSRA